MADTLNDYSQLANAVALLPFVKNHGIRFVSMSAGNAVVQMDYEEVYSTPPGLFPASMVGMLGDVAAISACSSAVAPAACATLDYTTKMLAPAKGSRLEAEGIALQAGSTTAVGRADIFAVSEGGERTHCATVLATGRVFGGK